MAPTQRKAPPTLTAERGLFHRTGAVLLQDNESNTVSVAAPWCDEGNELSAALLQLNLVEASVGICCSLLGVMGNARHHVEWCECGASLLHVALSF